MREVKTPANPSKTATKRVKNPLPVPTVCNMCGGTVVIKTHVDIYGRDYSDWPWAYGCDVCDSYVGMHPFTNIPLGTLADKATRAARNKAKAPFEVIHKQGYLTRKEAYYQLSKHLGIPFEHCHFGWFDIDMCEKALIASSKILRDVK